MPNSVVMHYDARSFPRLDVCFLLSPPLPPPSRNVVLYTSAHYYFSPSLSVYHSPRSLPVQIIAPQKSTTLLRGYQQ
ncbi:hypothetical protein WG66_007489 [Moniliophthora roreri]|nr:hypothetical protein WG66_013042 [Moniliophthora roreri]KAI3609782.1 hypothetical protein WG66_007489 [Moniliophthora roreri]